MRVMMMMESKREAEPKLKRSRNRGEGDLRSELTPSRHLSTRVTVPPSAVCYFAPHKLHPNCLPLSTATALCLCRPHMKRNRNTITSVGRG